MVAKHGDDLASHRADGITNGSKSRGDFLSGRFGALLVRPGATSGDEPRIGERLGDAVLTLREFRARASTFHGPP